MKKMFGLLAIAAVAALSAFTNNTEKVNLNSKKFVLISVDNGVTPARYYVGADITEKTLGDDYTCSIPGDQYCTVTIDENATIQGTAPNQYFFEGDVTSTPVPGTYNIIP